MKLVFIIRHMAEHDLNTPTTADLRALGYDLKGIYRALEPNVPYGDGEATSSVHSQIHDFLTEFARSTRYHNLKSVTTASGGLRPRVSARPYTHASRLFRSPHRVRCGLRRRLPHSPWSHAARSAAKATCIGRGRRAERVMPWLGWIRHDPSPARSGPQLSQCARLPDAPPRRAHASADSPFRRRRPARGHRHLNTSALASATSRSLGCPPHTGGGLTPAANSIVAPPAVQFNGGLASAARRRTSMLLGAIKRHIRIDPMIDQQRLMVTMQTVGSAVLQAQTVEDALGVYLALVHDLQPGVARVEAESVLSKYSKKTLGSLLAVAKAKPAFPASMASAIEAFKEERNWLVHRSRGLQRLALHSDVELEAFVERVDRVGDEGLRLQKEVTELMLRHLQILGFARDRIEAEAQGIFASWHDT